MDWELIKALAGLAIIVSWPISLVLMQATFNGHRQWYLISLVACIGCGMIGFLVVWAAYRLSGSQRAWEEHSRTNGNGPE